MTEINPLTEIYRDQWLLAVHKPAGLLVHRSPIDRHETEFALQHARSLNGGEHVYPVHRLDRPTSGLLLFARDPDTASTLGKMFMEGQVDKTYLAMVRGWTPESGMIDHPLREHPVDRRCKGDSQPLREAQSIYRRLATVEIAVQIEGYSSSRYSIVELSPCSGRKHQLRRHMQHISHPIIGDTNYGRTRHNHYFAERFGNSRLMLAATTMAFDHPVHGERLVLHAPLQSSFMNVLSVFGAALESLALEDERFQGNQAAAVESDLASQLCPLCREPNQCGAAEAMDSGVACWCFDIQISKEALARVPADQRNRACLCPRCGAGRVQAGTYGIFG